MTTQPRPSYLFILLILAVTFMAGPQPSVSAESRSLPASAAPAAPDTTLDVCLTDEPDSLYLYSTFFTFFAFLSQGIILSAVYDGPVDNLTYAYQPVILERVPSFENGEVVLETVTVNEGDTVVNDAGDVVTLVPGEVIRPSGCNSPDCAITYGGGPVDMDRLRVTSNLLGGLTWSDGVSLTASDSVYSFNLAAHPDTPTDKIITDRTASYTAPSSTQTVWVGLPGYLGAGATAFLNFWLPLPEHIWGAYTPVELLTAEVSSRMPMGWGPFIIDEWVSGSHIAMHKNPNYFRAGEGLPKFDSLIVHFSADPLGDLLAGSCDLVPSSTDDLAILLSYHNQGLLQLVVAFGTTWEHIDFGIQSAPDYTGFAAQTLAFQDPQVRKAFAYCLDRVAIADSAHSGFGLVPNAYIPDSHPYYPPDAIVYPFDPAQGRALLEAAGWIDSNGNGIRDKDGTEFSVNLTTTDSSLRMTLVGIIVSQMLNNCSIEVIPDHRPPGEVFAGWPDGPVFGRKFDLAEFAWILGIEPSCELYLTENIPSDANPSGQNDSGYSNPTYDDACHNALASLTEADKMTYHREAALIFTQDLPALPLFWWPKYGMAAPHIVGFALDPTEFALWNVEEIGTNVSIRSFASEDGWIVESQENSNQGGSVNATATTVRLGDDGQDRQIRVILSFNTAPLPDNAILLSVELRLKRQGLTGTSPFATHGTLWADIKRGAFGNNNALQPSDFQASASRNRVASLSEPLNDGDQSVGVLEPGALQFVNKTGRTQFRLRFNLDDNDDLGADYMRFHSGEAAAETDRPVLMITYTLP